MPIGSDFERRIERIDALVQQLESAHDPVTAPAVRAVATELVQSLLELHGVGLERIVSIVRQDPDGGAAMLDGFVRDDLVRSLLLLHDLHPVDVETRVRQALDTTRPYLQSHGGNVELVGVDPQGVVTLRMQGSCHGCPSSAMTLTLAIEQAIREAAPEVTSIAIADAGEHSPDHPPTVRGLPLVQLESANPATTRGAAGLTTAWHEVSDADRLPAQVVRVQSVGGQRVLVCRVDTALYAYAPTCAGCEHDLADARLRGAALTCTACGRTYDVVHAGRALGDHDLHLEPFPLLSEHGRVRVALPAAPALAGAT